MSKGLRTCCVCHIEHQFCPVCNPEDRKLEPWHFAYCSENCKDIYEVTSEYENGRLSANDAKEKLDKIDLSKIANFGESYQKSIEKINENFIPLVELTKVDDVVDNTTINKATKPKNKKVKNDDE